MTAFTIQLTAEQITYIGQALATKPYGEVVALVQAIQQQVDQQLAAAQEHQHDENCSHD